MITIPEIVEKIVKGSPFLEEGLNKKIVNLSALARIIKPQIETALYKKIENGAIIMALKRLSNRVDYKNIKKDLDKLVNMGYLKMEYPKKLVKNNNGLNQRIQDKTKELGYNIITGKLSFEISKILDPNGITPTLLATDMNKIYIADHKSNGLRKISIKESLLQFGFPKNYVPIENHNKMYDLLGNTVVVPVVKEISKIILNIYKD